MDQGEEPISFDMGLSTITRMNYWLWKSNEANFADDPVLWFRALKIVYMEIEAFMDKTETDAQKNTLKKINTDYIKYLNYNQSYQNNRKRGVYAPPRGIFDSLFAWEKTLRRIMDKEGLLMKKGERADQTMLKMG